MGLIFGGNDTKYTAIADNLNKAISKLNVEWPKFKQDELSNFDSAMDSLDKFWEINEKFKKMEVYQRRMSPCSNFITNKFQGTHQILLRKLKHTDSLPRNKRYT